MDTPPLPPSLLLELAHTVNLGLVLIDGDERIRLWNRWLEERSGLAADQALGRSLAELFPQMAGSRLEHAVRTALQQHLPAILSQSLNRAPFPLQDPLHREAPTVQQAITVAPLGHAGSNHCLVQIQDVTAAVLRDRQLREQAQQLQMLSNIDGLTGVSNRRSFDNRFQEEFQRALRSDSNLSVLMLDIDFFKEYNDTYGHQAGDTCLTLVANALKRSLQRGGDFVARYGGEEFAVVLPGCDHPCALQVAAMLQEGVSLLGIPHARSTMTHHVSVSIGVATTHPQRQDRPIDLLRAADAALYQAKRQGRNRVVSADPIRAEDPISK